MMMMMKKKKKRRILRRSKQKKKKKNEEGRRMKNKEQVQEQDQEQDQEHTWCCKNEKNPFFFFCWQTDRYTVVITSHLFLLQILFHLFSFKNNHKHHSWHPFLHYNHNFHFHTFFISFFFLQSTFNFFSRHLGAHDRQLDIAAAINLGRGGLDHFGQQTFERRRRQVRFVEMEDRFFTVDNAMEHLAFAKADADGQLVFLRAVAHNKVSGDSSHEQGCHLV